MTGLEILDQILLKQFAYHRRPDAWDLLDKQRRYVTAVLCTRKDFVSIAPAERPMPIHEGRKIVKPYGEKVKWKITADSIEEGVERVRKLVATGEETTAGV